MINFQKLKLKNYVYYDKAELSLNQYDKLLITGFNHDAKKKNSNGSGKSILVGSLGTLLFDTSPGTHKQKTAAKKDDFYRKDAASNLDFSIGEDKYSIRKYLKNKTLKLGATCNGKDLEFTTNTEAEKWFNKIFPISEELFYATVYLSTNRPSPLVIGTNTDRFDFICKLFGLDHYDKVRHLLLKKVAKLKEKNIIFKEHKSRLGSLKIKKQDINEKLKNINIQTIDKDIKILEEKQSLYKEVKTIIDLSNKVKKTDINIKDINISELTNERSKLEKKINSLSIQQEQYKKFKKFKNNHEKSLKNNKKEVKQEFKNYNERIEKLTKKVNVISDAISKLEKVEDICYVCQQEVSDKFRKETLSKLQKEQKTKKASLHEISKNRDKAQLILEAFERFDELKIDKPKNIKDLEEKLKQKIKLINNYKDFEDNRFFEKRLKESKFKSLQDVENTYKKLKKLDIGKQKDLLQETKILISKSKDLDKEIIEVKQEIKKLKNKLKDKKIYDELIKMCSNSGLKHIMCDNIMSKIIKRINSNVDLLFTNQKFYYAMTTNGIDIAYGDDKHRTYIRKLSGGEAKFFTVLLAVSLILELNDEQRTNLLIMDEMESNIDIAANRFYDELVPLVSEIIPNIIVVTPNPSHNQEFKEIKVVRKNNNSKLTGV